MPRIMRTTASTTNLGASATFTGDAITVPSYIDRVKVAVFADQTGNLFVEQSLNGSTFRAPAATAIVASTLTTIEVPLVMPYFRLRYANGAGAQGAFALAYVMLGPD